MWLESPGQFTSAKMNMRRQDSSQRRGDSCSPVESTRTGGAFYLRNVIEYLQSRGFHGDVVTFDDLSCFGKSNYFLANLEFICRLLLRERRRRVLFEDFPMHPWLFLFNWVARILGIGEILILVQLLDHHHQGSALLNALDKVLATTCLRAAALVIANSQTVAKELISMGVQEKRLRVVYPGCDPTERMEEVEGALHGKTGRDESGCSPFPTMTLARAFTCCSKPFRSSTLCIPTATTG